MTKLGLVAGLSLVLVGCASDGKDGVNGTNGKDGINGTTGANGATGTDGTTGPAGPAGPPGPQLALPALYTLTNAAATENSTATNLVSSYLRATNGNLSRTGSFATTGAGTGKGLGSQGALAFDARTQRFFAVNAGDNTISMLALDTDGVLTSLSTVDSGGKRPVSITVHAGTVYVVNQGDFPAGGTATPANISGFQVNGNTLMPIAGSTRPLSADADVHPVEIGFTPDGSFLIVAEEVGNKLDTFKVVNGVAQPGKPQDSANAHPFAFDFSPDGFLVITEVGANADGSTAGASTVSSYKLNVTDGTLIPITSALPTQQSSACWIAMAGDFAYIANTASNNITAVNVDPTGAVTLHDQNGVTATTGTGPIDLAVAPDHGFLYSLAGGAIHVFAIQPDGSLTTIGTLPNVPASASGLVAR